MFQIINNEQASLFVTYVCKFVLPCACACMFVRTSSRGSCDCLYADGTQKGQR